MTKKLHRDVWVGVVLLAFCAVAFFLALQISGQSAAVPIALTVLMAVCALFIVLKGLRLTREQQGAFHYALTVKESKNAFLFMGFIVLYYLVFRYVTYWIATPIFMIVAMKHLKVKSWKVNLLITALYMIICYVAFVIILQLPIGKEDEFKGIIDLFEKKAYIYNDDKGDDINITDIPDDMKDQAELYRDELIEKVCELDDDLTMMYLEGEEPSVEDMKKALRLATCDCRAVPVCCGSAYRNKGVQKLLDAILEFMPAPTDIPAIKGTDLDGNEVERHSSDEEPFSALAFKIMADPFVGKLAFFRVYSGTMNSGSYVLNATKGKKERVGRILQMHANKRAELDKVYSGDIAAAVGFKLTTTGDTICDEQHPVILESMEFPEPVIELAIEPKTKAGQGKMGEALAKLAEEDPTFKAHTDQETGQTIIAGMGELHLEIIVDRLLREFKVEANVGAPQVAYKETFTKPIDQEYKYAKQSGGRGQYGHCKVKFEPMDPNGEETFKYESSVVGGAIPKEYIPAVGEGIEEAAKAGILGGFPVLGVHANVYDGSYHEVDSSEMAFHIAGSMCFKEAMKKANPVLLEPIMKVEVTMPEEYMGDVIGDINSRRGRIEGMEDIGGGKMVRGYVPLAEMFGYSTDLRSKTQGRGNYSMFFEKYEQVPKSVQEKVLAAKSK